MSDQPPDPRRPRPPLPDFLRRVAPPPGRTPAEATQELEKAFAARTEANAMLDQAIAAYRYAGRLRYQAGLLFLASLAGAFFNAWLVWRFVLPGRH